MDGAGQIPNPLPADASHQAMQAGKSQDPNDKPEETLADVVADQEETQADFQAAYNAGGHFKEQLEAITQSWRAGEQESVRSKQHEVKEMEEIPENPKISPEVESHLERIEKDPAQMQQAADDYVKAVGMQPVKQANSKVILPLSDDQIKKGLHHKVWEAIRWLAEWCTRQLKILNTKS